MVLSTTDIYSQKNFEVKIEDGTIIGKVNVIFVQQVTLGDPGNDHNLIKIRPQLS